MMPVIFEIRGWKYRSLLVRDAPVGPEFRREESWR